MTMIELMREYPKACERLDIEPDTHACMERYVAGAALLWLTDRQAWLVPEYIGFQGHENTWRVVRHRNGMDEHVTACAYSSPLEAMLCAIENWGE